MDSNLANVVSKKKITAGFALTLTVARKDSGFLLPGAYCFELSLFRVALNRIGIRLIPAAFRIGPS